MMGYIDKELNIKTARGIGKYLTTIFGQEIMSIKVANSVRLIWAIDSKLHTYDIKASVIYVIQEEELDEAAEYIKKTILGNGN